MGLFKEARFAPLYAAIINIAFGIIGAIYLELPGVFIATVIARLFTYCIIDPYFVYRKGFDKSPKSYYGRFIVWMVLLFASYFISHLIIDWVRISGLLGLIFDAVISILSFNVIFLAVYGKTTEMKLAVNRIRKNILHK